MDICPEGFLRLMGVSEQLAFLDRRGSVHIDSTRFFTDEEYRAHAYTRLQTPKTIEGFRVFAVLRPDGAGSGRTIDTADALSLFPLDIYWSGKRVKRMHVEDLCGEHEIKTEYMGNDVYIRPSLVLSQQVSEKSLKELSLVWHGLSIGMHGLEPRNVLIEVHRDKPLTPNLGWTGVYEDEKAEAFALFVKDTLAAYCSKRIGELAARPEESGHINHKLLYHMRMAADVCTQEELDRFSVFYYKQVDRHFPRKLDDLYTVTFRAARPGEVLVNERLHLVIDGKTVWEEDDELAAGPILPEGTLPGAELPERRPLWLQVEDKVIDVTITSQAADKREFAWHYADIESDRVIKVLAVFDDNHEVNIYYKDSPDVFRTIEEAVFRAYLYNSDGDTYDTQRAAYRKAFDRQIAGVSGVYDLADLLEGLRIAGIDPYGVKMISTGPDVVTVITEKGEVVLRIAA